MSSTSFSQIYRALRSENRKLYRKLREEQQLLSRNFLSEDSITEELLFGIYKRLKGKAALNVKLHRMSRKQEHLYGSDFELWFGYQGSYTGYRIQAKRSDRSGNFKINILQGKSLLRGLGLPLYGIYYPKSGCLLTCAVRVVGSKSANIVHLQPVIPLECVACLSVHLFRISHNSCHCRGLYHFLHLCRRYHCFRTYSQLPHYIPSSSTPSPSLSKGRELVSFAHAQSWSPGTETGVLTISNKQNLYPILSNTPSITITSESRSGRSGDEGEQEPIDFPENPRLVLTGEGGEGGGGEGNGDGGLPEGEVLPDFPEVPRFALVIEITE